MSGKLAFFIGAALAGVVAPAVVGILRGATPDSLIARADVGVFVSSHPASGWVPTVTSVQTDRGSFSVVGHFSGVRGAPVELQDREVSGEQLCAVGGDACAGLSGVSVVKLTIVSRPHGVRFWLARRVDDQTLGLWLLIGVPLAAGAWLSAKKTEESRLKH